MAMNHDSGGFLVGERLDASDITGRLDAVREEVRGLRRDMAQSPSPAPSTAQAKPARTRQPEKPSTPSPASRSESQRDERPRVAVTVKHEKGSTQAAGAPGVSVSENRKGAITPRRNVGGSAQGEPAQRNRPPASQAGTPSGGRGSDGRFVAGSGQAGGDSESGMIKRSIDGLGDRLGGAVREAGAGTEEADPAVKAFNEVAQPMQRGLAKMMSSNGDRKQDRWYRRFWRMMRRSRRADQTEGKRQRRILKNIERKPVSDGSGSMLWRGLMMLLAPLTGMLSLIGGLPMALAGTLGKVLRPMLRAMGLQGLGRRRSSGGGGGGRRRSARSARPGAQPASSANSAGRASTASRVGRSAGRGGGMSRAARGLGRLAKGGARRIPIIGGLISAGFMASDVMASENSDATRAEKDKRTGGAVGNGLGGIGGMAAGGAAGAAVGSVVPVIGTAVGGVVGAALGGFFGGSAGEVIGEKVGGWVTDLRKSNLVQGITQKWEYATSFMGSIWEQASDGIAAKWDSVSQTVEGLWGSAKDTVTARWDSVTGKMKDHWDTAVSIAAKGWESLTDAMSSANDWIKEKTGVDVAEKAGEAKEWVSGKAADAAETVSAATDAAKKKAGEMGEKAKEKAGEVYDKAAEKAADAADKAGEAAASFWDSVKNKASDLKESVKDAVSGSAPARAARRAHNEASAEPALTQAMADAGITDENEQAAFMGQMSHESGNFRTMEESFNYSSADRIMSVSKTARDKGKEAVQEAMAQGPEAVANMMYGGRDDLGNTEEGDGYRFRGRGYTQLTGRDNYQSVGDALGIDLVNNPDMAKDPEIAAKVATHYWQSRDGLSEAAKKGDNREVTRLINGGTNGLADRQAATDEYLAAAQNGEFNVDAPNVAANDEPATPEAPAVATTRAPEAAPSIPPVGVPTVATASVTAPRMPDVSEAPTVSEPMNSPASQGSRRPTPNGGEDVSRDVSDRRLAHIVTGGYSGIA